MTTRILLIDDDVKTTNSLGAVLNQHGFEVIKTNSSSQGVQLVREHDLEAVLLDLTLLQLDGWQVCKEIHMASQVPVIIFSAFTEPDTITGVLDAGSDFFLVKPISIDSLVSHIKNQSQRPH